MVRIVGMTPNIVKIIVNKSKIRVRRIENETEPFGVILRWQKFIASWNFFCFSVPIGSGNAMILSDKLQSCS